jgi:hypothetical protein
LLLSAGGLCFAFPQGLLALALANFPHQSAFQVFSFHTYAEYYSAFILPILFWTSAIGADRFYKRLSGQKNRARLIGAILAVSAINLMDAQLPAEYRKANPQRYINDWNLVLESLRRPNASMIASSQFLYTVAFRSQIGFLNESSFVPDLVLVRSLDFSLGFASPLTDLFKKYKYRPVLLYPSAVLFERADGDKESQRA